jgi:hypothetical protein
MNTIITFNALKHHLNEIRKFINAPPDNYIEILETIGASLPDVYIGILSIEKICTEITGQLTRMNVLDKQSYLKWVDTTGGYRKIELSDGSKWILRISENEKFYIHIHPGRYSPYSIRLKAGALKTTICFLINSKMSKKINISTQQINQARNTLGLSPIKDFNECKIIKKAIAIIQQQI